MACTRNVLIFNAKIKYIFKMSRRCLSAKLHREFYDLYCNEISIVMQFV